MRQLQSILCGCFLLLALTSQLSLAQGNGVVMVDFRDTSIEVNKGTTVRINCNVVSIFVPNVVYQWNILERNGVMRRSDISQDRMFDVSPNVTTTYQCIARFISGDDLQQRADGNITIIIPDPPVIATPVEPSVTDSGIEVMIGNNTCINNTFTGMVNFTCVVVSGAFPITFNWQVGGEAFMNNSHSMEIRFNNTVSILIVGIDTGASVDRDLNNYTCNASNSDGSDMAVSVLSRCETAPVIEMGNFTIGCPLSEGNIGGNYSNITGGQVRIYCRLIDGFPFPSISWFYMGSELIMFRNSSEISITVENDTIGEYTCVATNALGMDSASSFVDVQFPPVINRSLGLINNISVDLYEINVGEDPFVEVPFNITNVILYCVVSGREMPTVNWTTPPLDNDTFNIETIVEMNGLLFVVTSVFNISNFTNDYAGLYQCNASNCAGQDGIGVDATQQVVYFVGFSSTTFSASEGSTSSVSLFVSQPAPFDISLTLQASDITAMFNTDYFFMAGSTDRNVDVVIPVGSTTHDVSFTVRNDTIVELDETFQLQISLSMQSVASDVLLAGTSATIVTLEDSRSFSVMVAFMQSSFTAVDTGSLNAVLQLIGGTFSTQISIAVTPSQQTPVSAEGGVDFETAIRTATFADGATMATVSIPLIVDNIVEMDEEFVITINQPTVRGLTLGTLSMATGIIQDSSTVDVQFSQDRFIGSEASGFVMVNLELIGGSSASPFTVLVTPLEQLPVSAEGGVDFNTTTLIATFDSGMIMSSVRVPVFSDFILERDENFDLALNIPSSAGRGVRLGSRNTSLGVITDSTMLIVEFASAQFVGSESTEFVEVTVRVTGGVSSSSITVTVTPSEQSPVSAMGSGVDYNSDPFTITIDAGATEGRANISVTCDDEVEGMETFDMRLTLTTSIPGVVLGRSASVGQIIDSTVAVSFSQSSYEVMEDNGTVTLVIALSQPSSVPFEVTIGTVDMTASSGGDYIGGIRQINVPAQTTSQSFTVAVINDDTVECVEAFSVVILSVTTCGVTISNNRTEVMITDDDGATVSLSESQYSVVESDTPLPVTIMLSNRASEDVVVEVTLSDGSANVGVDYAMSLMFNVTISAGSSSESFDVDIIDDMIQEDNETFNIAIRLLPSCLSFSLGTSSSTVTIIDDDVAMITFSSSTFSGSESSGVISATVIISGGVVSSSDITVPITFTEGTAIGSNVDFNSATQNAIITAGTNSSTVNIAVINDNIIEGNEMFTINLNVPVSPGIVAGTVTMATATIIDSSMIMVRFTQDQFTGSEFDGFVQVLVELNQGSSTRRFTVMVTPSEQSPVSAEGGVDFNTTTLTATFNSGETTSSVMVPVTNDNIAEGSEQFNLMLTVPPSLAPAITAGNRNAAMGVITDSTMLTVEFASGQFTGSESSGFIEVIVRVTGGVSSSPITVTVIPSEQSPVSAMGSGIDFDSNPFNVTIAAGAMQGRGNISVVLDNEVEPSETFDLSLRVLTSSSQIMLGRDTSVGQITDSTVVVNFDQPSYSVMEDDAAVVVGIALSQSSSMDIVVEVDTMDVTATEVEDYVGGTRTVTIPAGDTTGPVMINIADDNIVECSESFNLRIVSVSDGGVITGSVNSTEVIIMDSDGATVSLSESQYSVAESDTLLPVTIMLNNRASEDVVVEVTLSDGSANAGVDYAMSTALMFNVTISAESLSQSFDVDIIDDMILEGNETFNIAIRLLPSCLSLSLGTSSSTVTIIDNDVAMITFSSSTFSGSESSGVISATVIISGGVVSSSDITVPITFTEGTATGGNEDFNSATQNAVITAGTNSSTVNIAVTNDNIVEGNEMFTINLIVPVSPGIAAGTVTMATATIIDTSMIRVRFTQDRFTGSESQGFVEVFLELNQGSSTSPFTVMVTPSEQSPVSAQGGVDFNTTTLTATFNSGETRSSVMVPVTNDNIAEGSEQFNLMLTVPPSLAPAIRAGNRNTAMGVITDSTMLMVEFASGQFTGSESLEFIEVTVRVTGGVSSSPITVTVTPSEQSPVSAMGSGTDFNSDPFTITIIAGATEGRANISVTCDDEVEGMETFDMRLTLTSSGNGVTLGRDTSVGEIIDSTVAVSFSQSLYGVMEDNGTVSLVIALDQPSSVSFEVSIRTMDVTAIDGEDYSGRMEMIAIPARVMTRLITISITDDNLVECVERFIVTITSVTTCGVTISNNMSEVIITDDDRATVSLSELQFSVAESDTRLPVTIMLSNRASEDVVVEVTLSDGSANAGVDYAMSTPLMFNVTISASSRSELFNVDIIDDMIQEDNETFNIVIRLLPSCLSLSPGASSATVTIIDNDVAMITFSSSTFSGSESSGVISATVIISGGVVSSSDITVPITFTEGTATGNRVDFNSATQNAIFTAGTNSSTVNIAVTNDNIVEGDETFIMNLNVPVSPGIVAGTVTMATATIIDSSTLNVIFTQDQFAGSEAAGFVLVSLELDGGTSESPFDVTVTPSQQSPLSAEGNVDFSTIPQSATFGSRMSMSNVTVLVFIDNIAEGPESFDVMLSVPMNLSPAITAGSRNSAVGVITDSTRLIVEFTSAKFTGSESSGFIEVIIRIRMGQSNDPIIVTVTPSEQSPVSAMGSGVDYNSDPFNITIDAGATEGRANISVTCDDEVEGSETFDMRLTLTSSGNGVTLGRDTSVGEIIDSTVAVSFSQSSYEVMEDNGTVSLVIALSQPSSVPFQVSIGTMDVTAVDGEDYSGTMEMIAIPARVTTRSITISITDDNLVECAERFIVTITSVTTCGVTIGANNMSEVIITDDDRATVSLSESQYSVVESDTPLPVTIMLSNRASEDVVVEVTLSDGSANAGIDYAMSTPLMFNVTITAGSSSRLFDVDIFNDMIQEDNETFNIAIRLLPSCLSLSLGTSSSTVTIIDNDVAMITFSSSTFSGSESSGVISATVTISGGVVSSSDITVPITFTEGTATAGGIDFDSSTQNARIIAGTSSQIVNITVTNDAFIEGNETFNMNLNVPTTPGVVPGAITTATGIILDSTSVRVVFSRNRVTIMERTRSVSLDVVLSGGTFAEPFSVFITATEQSPVSAEADVDFDASTQTVTFRARDPFARVTIQIMEDDIVEAQEEFILTIVIPSSIAGITLGDPSTAVVAIDDSTRITVEFTESMYSGSEFSGEIIMDLQLDGGRFVSPSVVNVTVTATPRSATGNGVDFVSEPLIATFMANSTIASVLFPVVLDDIEETNETFDVSLMVPSSLAPSIQAGNPRFARATIIDSTVLVRLSQSTYRVDEDDGSLMILISLSHSSEESIMVTVNTSDITANVNEDYGQAGTTRYSVVFPPGSTMQSITIPIINDNVREGNETFRAAINPLSILGVILGTPNMAVITIIETTEIAVRFSRGHFEAAEVSRRMEVEIILIRGISTVPVGVTVMLRSGSATAGVDFDSAPLTGSIPAGENSTTVVVPIMQDNIIERDEMFFLELQLPTAIPGITLGSANMATGTITDSTVQVSFEDSSYSVMEGGNVMITVVLSAVGSQEYTVTIRSRDNSARAGSDYDDRQIDPVTFPVGTVTQSFSISTLSDNVYEFNETFSLSIQPSSTLGLALGNPRETQVTIIDNSMIQVEFSTSSYMGTEMSRSVPVSLVITNGSIARSFSVSVQPSQLTPPSATRADFDATTITAEFDVNNFDPLTSNIRVPVVTDRIVEGRETFGLSVTSSIPQVTIGSRSTATGVILDSTIARVQFSRGSYSGEEASGFVDVGVTLSGGTSANPFTVRVIPSEQSPVSAEGGVDFNTATQIARFASGETTSSVRIPVMADNEVEPTEQFDLTLSMPSQTGIRLGALTSATGNIIDSTVTVNFQRPAYTALEDSRRRNILLSLSSQLSEPISVVILAQNMTAIAGMDYEVPGGGSQFNVDIPAETESQSFSVDILDDNLLERTESFRLTIIQTNSTIVTTGSISTADISITDNEELVVGFSAPTFAGTEISGGIQVDLDITGGVPSQSIRVDIRPRESAIVSARAGSDFDSTSRSATFNPENRTSSVTIPAFLDNLLEGNETFALNLNVRVPRVSASSSRGTATGIILDSTVAVSFEQANYSINENSVSPLRPVLILSQPFPDAVNVIVRAQNASAIAGSDYGPQQSYAVTFPPGSIRESFDVNIIGDNVLERDEIFLLNLTMTMLPNGVIIGQPDSAEVTIIETTVLTVEFESATYSAREGQGLSVTLVLSGGTFSSDVVVSITPSEQQPVSAQGSGIDFISRPISALFPAGRSQAAASISLVCDREVEGNEEFNLGLSVLLPASGVNIGSQSMATAIIMDATIEVAFVSGSSRVNEDVGIATIPVMVSSLSTQGLTFSAVSSGNSATGGEDYGQTDVPDPQTFLATIPPSSARGNLQVAIIDDNTFESEEQFTLMLQSPQQCNVALSGQIAANITIVDNDIIGVEFAEGQYFGSESSRVTVVRVIITGGLSSNVVMATVQPSQLSPVSANGGGVDFDSDPIVATFQPNQDSTTVRIPLVCDTEVEGNERFNITLSANLPVTLGARSTAIGIIQDSTVAVSFGLASYTFPEDASSASINITLNQPHGSPLSVDVSSEDLTAIARMDYSRIQSRIPIPAGSTSASVLVNIINDNILEQTETFRLNIIRLLAGGFCGATIGRMSTEVSITDNDVVTVEFQQPQFTGTEESQVLIATVVLFGGTVSFPFAVTVTSSSRTAIAGSDFNGMPITVVFSPGDQNREVRIPLVCDTNVEAAETFLMSLSTNVTNSRLRLGTQRTAIGNIEDSTVTVSFSDSNYIVNEGRGQIQLEIEFSQETSQDFTIIASTMDGTATAPQDYSSINRPLFISQSSTSSRFSIDITNDRILEDDEQFSVSLQLPTNVLACGLTLGSISMANVTILDNEVLTVQFSRREYVGTESNGLLSAELMLSGGIPSVPFNVTVISSELSPPSAIGNGVDFDSSPRTATFDPSSTNPVMAEVQIPLTRDIEIEEPERFSLVLMLDTTNPSIRLGFITTARGIIEDSTVFVQFDMEEYSVAENDGPVEIQLILNEMPGVAVNATVTTADLTADGSDYLGGQYLVQFSASEVAKTLMIGIIDNNIVEDNEMFQLTLTAEGQLAVGNRDMATVLITDNEDVSVNFTQESFTATEVSGIMPVNLMLSGGVFNTSATVSVTTMPQSATAGIDYNPNSVDAVFLAGERSATVGIPILLDNEAEEDEQFGLVIAIPSELNAVLSLGTPSNATGIIEDSSVSVEFEFRTYQINEDEDPVRNQPTLVLSRPLTVDIMVDLNTENLSASAGVDFIIEDGPIVIPANSTIYPIMIEVLNDDVFERSETFRLNVMVPQSSAQLGLIQGDIPSTRVTINNDDGQCRNITSCINGTVVVPRGSTCSVCAVWQVGPFGMCMPDCHLGNRTREVLCIDRDNTRSVLDDFRCDDSARPPSVERCGRGPCMIRPRWRRSRWSMCTRTCEGGSQTRRVYCYSPVEDKVLPDNDCDSTIRPRSFRLCNQHIRCECIDLYPTYCSRIMGTAQCMEPEYHQACCMSCAGAD